MMDMRAAPVVAFLAAAACAGCGTVAPSPAALRDFIQRADLLMYRAKDLGRTPAAA